MAEGAPAGDGAGEAAGSTAGSVVLGTADGSMTRSDGSSLGDGDGDGSVLMLIGVCRSNGSASLFANAASIESRQIGPGIVLPNTCP